MKKFTALLAVICFLSLLSFTTNAATVNLTDNTPLNISGSSLGTTQYVNSADNIGYLNINSTFSNTSTSISDLGSSGALLNTVALSNNTAIVANFNIYAHNITVGQYGNLQTLYSGVVADNVTLGNYTNLGIGENSSFGTVLPTADNNVASVQVIAGTQSISGTFGSPTARLTSFYVSGDSETTTNLGNISIYSAAIVNFNFQNIRFGGTIDSSIQLFGERFDLVNGANLNGTMVSPRLITTSGEVTINSAITSGTDTVLVVNSGSTLNFNNNATIHSADISGIFNVGNASRIINTALTTESGGGFGLTVTDASTYGQIVINSGSAVLDANTVLKVNLDNAASNGSTYTILTSPSLSGSAISGANININDSNDNIYNGLIFTTSISGNNLILTASAQEQFTNSNVQGTYDAILNAKSPTGNLATLQSYIENTSVSGAAKDNAIKSASPQVDNSNNRVSFNTVNNLSNLVSARISAVRNGAASGVSRGFSQYKNFSALSSHTINSRNNAFRDDEPNQAVWVQAIGEKINQGNTSESSGYNASSIGSVFGFDKELSDELLMGVSGSFTNSKIDSRDNQSTNINSYQVGIYSGYTTPNFFFNSMTSFALNQYYSKRYIEMPGATATSNYYGKSYSARVEMGRDFKVEKSFFITPTLTLTAARNSIDSYAEEGAGSLNLQVKTKNTNFFEGRVGNEISKFIKKNNGDVIRPYFGFSYGYDFIGDKQKSTSNFVGQNLNFSSQGSKVAQGSLKLNAGVTIFKADNVRLNANYSFEHRSNYSANSMWLNARWGF